MRLFERNDYLEKVRGFYRDDRDQGVHRRAPVQQVVPHRAIAEEFKETGPGRTTLSTSALSDTASVR